MKPVISGFDPARAGDSDTGVLLRALGLPLTEEEIEDISPWRFAAPLSPDMAARARRPEIDFERWSLSARPRSKQPRPLLIEGVGGIMVPLDRSNTVLDWMRALDLPSFWSPAAISAASAIR